MTWIALKMLTGDRSKFYAIVFGVTFASLLITEQSATFCGVMMRTTGCARWSATSQPPLAMPRPERPSWP